MYFGDASGRNVGAKQPNQPKCKKTKWMPSEDDILAFGVKSFGNEWTKIAKLLIGRSPKQCRERWTGQLDPSINHSDWTVHEDSLLITLQSIYGNKWASIARQLPGRAPNSVKNRFRYISKTRTLVDEATKSPPEVIPTKPVQQEEIPTASFFDEFQIDFFSQTEELFLPNCY